MTFMVAADERDAATVVRVALPPQDAARLARTAAVIKAELFHRQRRRVGEAIAESHLLGSRLRADERGMQFAQRWRELLAATGDDRGPRHTGGQAGWAAHYGPLWARARAVKRAVDPDGLLAPRLGISAAMP